VPADKPAYLRSLRLLAEAFQAFEHFSGQHVRELGLTPDQFDIVATLGDTPGMSFRELGRKTLITKGTLTGVVDRLEARGLVKRVANAQDRRSVTVRLTPAGEREFVRVFRPHIDHCGQGFADFSAAQLKTLEQQLTRLRDGFLRARCTPVSPAAGDGRASVSRGPAPRRSPTPSIKETR
jgi:DNA-binding MarR family transcriptional regulator